MAAGHPYLHRQVHLDAIARLAEVHEELLRLYGKKLVPAPHGKAKEMCRRLYPEIFA